MVFEPPALLMLVVLVAVTGYVAKNLMITWHRLRKGEPASGDRLSGLEERMRNVESATSSLLVDVTGLREKQRFMARLGERPRDAAAPASSEAEISPLVTQSIPIMPRAGSPRRS